MLAPVEELQRQRREGESLKQVADNRLLRHVAKLHFI